VKKRPAFSYSKQFKNLDEKIENLKIDFCCGKYVSCQIILKEIEDLSRKLRCELSLIKTKGE